jgi:hydroxypyruvate reductase
MSQEVTMTEKTAQMRKDALDILGAAIKSVDPETAVNKHLKISGSLLEAAGKVYDLNSFERIIIVGAGKATAPMAKAVEDILADYRTSGAIVVKYGHGLPLKTVEIIEAGHPQPDESGHEGAKKIAAILNKATQNDLVISLISGGGSALLPMPAEGISLAEKKEGTGILLKCGASIHELNTIRKHLSAIKGGGFAKIAYPATIINLMLSDVIGDDMDVLASGPFVPDHSTFADALEIVKKYGIEAELPESVMTRLKQGASGIIEETPKPADKIFDRVSNIIIASNIMACRAADKRAELLGYNTIILSSMMEGDTTELACAHIAIAKETILSGNPVKRPACIISGGETTVKVKGSGMGGRNQEFALVAAREISGLENDVVILSAGTDGTDGPTDAAGGMADTLTVERGEKAGLDLKCYLETNDSYNYLKQTSDLIITGPTRTNVMDVRIMLIA